MGLLNQSTFPRLWRLFQWSIGGCCHKRRIVLDRLGGRKNILEVGCSVGNIAEALRDVPRVRYTGVDIDRAALRTARKSFRNEPRFEFFQGEIERLELPESSFDLIILSAVLHHVDDDGCRRILKACSKLLCPDGLIVVTDPVQPIKGDSPLVRFFNSIEQGRFVRPVADFEALMSAEPDLEILMRQEFLLKGSPLGFPDIARCMTLELRRVNVNKEPMVFPRRKVESATSAEV